MEVFQCPKECRPGEKTPHEFILEKGEYNEIYTIRCKHCQHEHDVGRHAWFSTQIREGVRPSRAYLTAYPRIEPHTGELVKSREHEREVVKHAGFHVAEHGVNERYNDETCEALKQNRSAYERRMRAIQERQKYRQRTR